MKSFAVNTLLFLSDSNEKQKYASLETDVGSSAAALIGSVCCVVCVYVCVRVELRRVETLAAVGKRTGSSRRQSR